MTTLNPDLIIEHGLTVNGNTTLAGPDNDIGQVSFGTWNASAIGIAYGGTGVDLTGAYGYIHTNDLPAGAGTTVVAQIPWADIADKPTTIVGYGIVDLPAGYTGSRGTDGIGFSIAKSYLSVADLTADTAPVGITPGQFAIIETGNVNDAENSRLYLWSGTAYSYVTDLSGSQGFTGPQGLQGTTGYTGSQGNQGVIGYTGSQGDQGVQGVTGFVGSKGDIGNQGAIGYTGSKGDQGIQGIQGATGFTGSQGIQGATGFTGSQGIQGATGFTGSQGIQGIGYTGSQGDIGPIGNVGLQGLTGFTGSIGFTGSQGAGFTGSKGDTGIQGPIGYTGSKGDIGGTGIQGPVGFTGSGYGINAAVQMGSLGVGTVASGVSGEIRAIDNITAYYSDRRLKDVTGNIPDALNKVCSLNGVIYTANALAASYGYDTSKQQVGLIAQEVEAVLPQVVVPAPFDIKQNDDGTESSMSGQDYKTLHYDKVVPLLVEAIKELKLEIDKLKHSYK